MAMPAAAVTACCLVDADVEAAVGEPVLERQQPGRTRHRRRDRDDARVSLRFLDDRFSKRLGVAGGDGLRRPDERVEHRCIVEVLLVVVLGRRIAVALLRQDVHEDRTVLRECDGVVHACAPSARCRVRRTGRHTAHRAPRRTTGGWRNSRTPALKASIADPAWWPTTGSDWRNSSRRR